MTEVLLDCLPDSGKVLEIGTGCGYQTAVLARLIRHVYSIERIAPLLERTRERLRSLQIGNVTLKCADGSHGWSAHAPFDGIIVTAAAPVVPEALLRQLAPGGVLVLPEGRTTQILRIYQRHEGAYRMRELEAVRFVPLLPGIERGGSRNHD